MRNRTYVDSDIADVNMRGFTDKEIRKNFIRKVYCLLILELCILFGFSMLGAFCQPLRDFAANNFWATLGTMVGCFVGSMVPYYALTCYTSVRTKVPVNYIVFNLFVLMVSVAMMFITATYQPYVFVCAFGTTMAIVVLLTLFSFLPCVDVTGWGLYILAISCFVSIFAPIAILLYIFLQLRIMILIYAGLVALLSCVYIVFCTQLIIGGHKYELNPDEYILGCIMLFTHILTLLLSMMTLFNN